MGSKSKCVELYNNNWNKISTLNMKRLILIIFSVVLLFPKLTGAQATSVTLGGNSSTLSATYNTATAVDPTLTITANGNITGFRVQISQTYTSGDVLGYTGTLPTGITQSWNSTTGVLSFNGTTTAANWQTLLRTVTFRSTSSTCYANQRRITFVAGTVYYNPLTEHFYEYLVGTITWTGSYTAASSRSYFGRAGYLATMSSEAENNFVWKLMSSDAWFGACDDYLYVNAALGTSTYASQAAVEGKWHWVTGPEKGTNFSNGNGVPTTVSGQYAKWAGGEPNNSGNEHYGQFYSSNSGQWNDLPNTNLPGYICEYGDMPGDITSSTTIFTKEVTVSGASSGIITGGDINVCSGSNSTTLTITGMTGSVVRWESSFDNFFTAGTTITSTASSITVTNLTKTTYYRAIVNSTSPTSCASLATSSIFLSVKPTKSGSVFAANNTICSGGLAELTLSGQQGNVNKWQRSTDNINWTNITNSTSSLTETVASAGTYYYRVEVQTPSCGSAVYSTSKSITVTSGTPPTGGTVSSAVHLTTTNSGTLTLSGYTGTVVKWQKSTNDGVTWSDITNTAATYSYTNQTDGTLFRAQLTSGTCGNAFSSAGTITVAPFTHTGFVYNSENIGMQTVVINLLYKLKTDAGYASLSSTTTAANGSYSFSTSLSVNKYDFTISISSLTIDSPTSIDAESFTQKILYRNFASKDYYRMDVNSNGILSIADVFLVYAKKSGLIPSWVYPTPTYRIFTAAQWSIINSSLTSLVTTYPGVQALTTATLTSGGTTNFYIVRTGSIK
jgi:hypothetical protein